MSSEEILREAITLRRPVSLCYDSGAPRTVHPHAIYRSSTGKICLDGYQIDGPTSSGGPLPGWRPFNLAKISRIEMLEGEFQMAAGFDPGSAKYAQGLLASVRP